ncbi:MAG TPA: hypothetical protein VN726_22935 [Hanamia sp.]|nr:hypothetical protein [Hanamia sp.]
MNNNLYIVDERILELAEILKEKGKFSFTKGMFDEVGISKQKVNNVKNYGESFTFKQVETICKKFNVDMNWIFGFQHENPFLKKKKLQLIKQE